MDSRSADTEGMESNGSADSDRWTDAELVAYDQLEVDLYTRYIEMTSYVRKFLRRPGSFMARMFRSSRDKRHPTIR